MKYPGIGEHPSKGTALFLRLAIVLAAGTGAGLGALALTYYQMGRTPRTDDVAYALGVGIACLVIGILLMCWPIEGLTWLWSMLVALVLGTGVAFSILSVFWWMQRKVFVYDRYPDLNYLLGEVSGYAGPGLGLLTCGIVLIRSYFVWLDNRQRSLSGDRDVSLTAVAQPQRRMLGFLLCLALVSVLGAGAGLLSGAMTYILLGTKGPTSEIAGFMACGFGCFMAGGAFFWLCIKTDELSKLARVGALLFLLTGFALCSVGLFRWLI